MNRVVDLHEPNLVFDLSTEPLIPDDRYQMVYVKHSYGRMFKGHWKLVMNFRIVEEGRHFETVLKRFYNVRKLERQYRAPKSGDLTREMADLFGRSAMKQGIPWDKLRSSVILGETRTISSDSNNRTMSGANRYSVVGRLIKVVT